MYRALQCSLLAATFVAALLVANTSHAADYSVRQYYGQWQQATNYSYRCFYYKPTPTYVGYKFHYCIYTPSRPNYYYFYNPYAKKFWGRCPVESYGKPAYSILEDKYRSDDLGKIPETAFPAPGALPRIPESQDGAVIDLPPADLNAAPGIKIGG